MAVVAVNELRGVRTGKMGADWKRYYRRAWRVQTDNPLTGALAVRLAIPVDLGDVYKIFDPADGVTVLEYDNFAFVTNIEAAIDGGANDDCSWIVSVEYGPYDPTAWPENPLDQPLKITWGGSRFQRVCEQTIPDVDDIVWAVVNSAGEYFDPPIMVDDSRPTLQVVRNEQYFDPTLALTWKDTINSDVFFGFAAHCVKLSLPTGDLNFNPICGYYYVVTYEFEINPETWHKFILDQGMHVWDGTSDKLTPAKDKDGADMTTPVLLDGAGGQLVKPAETEPVYLEFEVYQERDFSLLGLDPTGAPGQPP